jgi:hypothetical protein
MRLHSRQPLESQITVGIGEQQPAFDALDHQRQCIDRVGVRHIGDGRQVATDDTIEPVPTTQVNGRGATSMMADAANFTPSMRSYHDPRGLPALSAGDNRQRTLYFTRTRVNPRTCNRFPFLDRCDITPPLP